MGGEGRARRNALQGAKHSDAPSRLLNLASMNQFERAMQAARSQRLCFGFGGLCAGRCEPQRGALAARSWDSYRGSLRYRAQHSGHSHDVARGRRQLEVLIDPFDATVDGLADSPDGLAPTEVVLDSLSDHLAGGVARVMCRKPINGAAPLVGRVARHVRGDAALPAGGHEVPGVVSLVGSNRLRDLQASPVKSQQ